MVTLSVQFLLINSVEGFFLISFYILHNISGTLFTSKTWRGLNLTNDNYPQYWIVIKNNISDWQSNQLVNCCAHMNSRICSIKILKSFEFSHGSAGWMFRACNQCYIIRNKYTHSVFNSWICAWTWSSCLSLIKRFFS